jgi:hypothetical protein
VLAEAPPSSFISWNPVKPSFVRTVFGSRPRKDGDVFKLLLATATGRGDDDLLWLHHVLLVCFANPIASLESGMLVVSRSQKRECEVDENTCEELAVLRRRS